MAPSERVGCTRGSAAGHVDVRTSLDGSVTMFCDAPIASLAFTSFFGSGFVNGTQNANILTTVRNIGTAPAQNVSLRVSLTRSPSGLLPVPVTVPSACTNLGFGAVYDCDIGDRRATTACRGNSAAESVGSAEAAERRPW